MPRACECMACIKRVSMFVHHVCISVYNTCMMCVWAQDVIEYAIYLGINPRKEAHLLFIAQVCIYRCIYVFITYTHTHTHTHTHT